MFDFSLYSRVDAESEENSFDSTRWRSNKSVQDESPSLAKATTWAVRRPLAIEVCTSRFILVFVCHKKYISTIGSLF